MKYLRRAVALSLICILVSTASGCDALRKKFIRKPKTDKKASPVLVPQDYRGIYTNEVLYNNHFTYWRGWTDELLDSLAYGLSNKRQIEAARRAIEDLQRMQELLNNPKREALSPHIKFYERILNKLQLGRPNDFEATRMKQDIEIRRRVILRDFETKDMKAFILKEEAVRPISTVEQTLEQK